MMLYIYTPIIVETEKRSVAPHVLLSFFLHFSLFFGQVNLFSIGSAVRFLVSPIVTIPIIHSVQGQER